MTGAGSRRLAFRRILNPARRELVAAAWSPDHARTCPRRTLPRSAIRP